PFQPRYAAVERRANRKHREEAIEERRHHRGEDQPVEKDWSPQHGIEPLFEERSRGNEARKEERQQPGVAILQPLEEDHQTDDEEQQRIRPENLVGYPLCG